MLTGCAERRIKRNTYDTSARRHVQNAMLADRVGRVRAPEEMDCRWSEVRDFVCHLDGAAVQTNRLPCCNRIDRPKRRERSKLGRGFFYRPAQRPQLPQTWRLLAAKKP